MDPLSNGVFQMAEQRLAWADRRQQVLAQNVANISTPGYQAKDMTPFSALLDGGPALAQTSPLHLAGTAGQGAQARVEPGPQNRAPDGNSVSVERELGAVADTSGIQELALNLHHSYAAMFKTAFGGQGSRAWTSPRRSPSPPAAWTRKHPACG